MNFRRFTRHIQNFSPIQTGLSSLWAKGFKPIPNWLRLFAAQGSRILPVGLTILVSWAWNGQAAAQSVTLAWDPAANAAGYLCTAEPLAKSTLNKSTLEM